MTQSQFMPNPRSSTFKSQISELRLCSR